MLQAQLFFFVVATFSASVLVAARIPWWITIPAIAFLLLFGPGSIAKSVRTEARELSPPGVGSRRFKTYVLDLGRRTLRLIRRYRQTGFSILVVLVGIGWWFGVARLAISADVTPPSLIRVQGRTAFLQWGGLIALLILVPFFRLASVPLRVFSVVIAVFGAWWMWVQYGAAAVAAVWAETQAEEQILAPSKTVAATASTALERMGQAGDMFGGFNALFSAFAFSGVAVAAYFQWKMNRQVRVQAFESTFFSAVELLHKIAEGISYDPYLHAQQPLKAPRATKSPIIGREAFQEILNGLANCNPLSPSDTQGLYKSLQSDHNYMLGHYFRHLYQTLKWIDGQSRDFLAPEEKRKYSSMLRAQLSTSELALLLLNCLDRMVDEGQFRNLVIRYHMLEHLPLHIANGYVYGKETSLPLCTSSQLQDYYQRKEVPRHSAPSLGAFGSNPYGLPRTFR